MFQLARTLPLALLVAGCVVYDEDHHHVPPPSPAVNHAPVVLDAAAGVFWDEWAHDDIWYFDAEVDDPDSPYDVVQVWADVYDDWSGELVDSFELFPTDDPFVWYAEYYGHDTWLDPFYPHYSVDLVAYDSWDAYDFITVPAYTY